MKDAALRVCYSGESRIGGLVDCWAGWVIRVAVGFGVSASGRRVEGELPGMERIMVMLGLTKPLIGTAVMVSDLVPQFVVTVGSVYDPTVPRGTHRSWQMHRHRPIRVFDSHSWRLTDE